jgi:hypothetical protein
MACHAVQQRSRDFWLDLMMQQATIDGASGVT